MGGEEQEISQTPHFPIGGRTQVDGLSQFHREIGVSILFVDIARSVVEQSDGKVALRRHIRYSSH